MSYFHERMLTIIGDAAFHGPVRDGKGWYHRSMVVRHNLLLGRYAAQPIRREDVISHSDTGCNARTTLRVANYFGHEPKPLQSYRVKPHGQLVPVSLTCYHASTPGLSTSWSRTTLQGDQVPGRSHLQASFPLRCFQRLSLPHIATLRCHWRDNRYTRGASTPVLSY